MVGALSSVLTSRRPIAAAARLLALGGCGASVLLAIYLVSPTHRGAEVSHTEAHAGHHHDPVHDRGDQDHEEGSLEVHLLEHFLAADNAERARMLPELEAHTGGIEHSGQSIDQPLSQSPLIPDPIFCF